MQFLTKDTKVLVQGITGKQGSFNTKEMLKFGTNIVAGVTPGKGGNIVEGVPVYNSVKEAQEKHDFDLSVLFVPPTFCRRAAMESLDAGVNIVIITEGIPVHDTVQIVQHAQKKKRYVIGPNCPGITSPGMGKVGIMPNHIFRKGDVGIVSRSGTLTYEIVYQLSKAGIGQSTVIGIGGDPVTGIGFQEALDFFKEDDKTSKIVLIGEIGGNLEEKAAEYLKSYPKQVIGYIVGLSAPPDKHMGHAGAVIAAGRKEGTAKSKILALRKAGVEVAELPNDILKLL